MANYPYISGQSTLVAAFAQLRKGIPPKVDSGYLKRFKIAPANESYVITILRFLGLIDDDGVPIESETKYFYGGDAAFISGFEKTLRSAYSQLLSEMGDDALTSARDPLAHWFRAADKTSDLVGQRQASTFLTLAALAGYGELPTARSGQSRKNSENSNGAKKRTAATSNSTTHKSPAAETARSESRIPAGSNSQAGFADKREVGLTFRIEVNLPAGGDAKTYDAIFASIKKHLMS